MLIKIALDLRQFASDCLTRLNERLAGLGIVDCENRGLSRVGGKQKAHTMQIPLQISFRNMDPSPAVEERIRKKAAKFERFHDRIVGCTVVVEAPHRHQHKGKLYSVRVDISVPGKDVIVDRAKPADHAHEDVYVAIRDAFNAATRRLEEHARKLRGDVKTPARRLPVEG